MEKSRYCVVLITAPEPKMASSLAAGLVQEKLAACVNEIPSVTSHYFWEGKLHKDQETLLVAKTKTALLAELAAYVKRNHSAQIPEIIALPIVEGLKPYLEWLGASTRMTRPPTESQFLI